jgi:hypothetical protein
LFLYSLFYSGTYNPSCGLSLKWGNFLNKVRRGEGGKEEREEGEAKERRRREGWEGDRGEEKGRDEERGEEKRRHREIERGIRCILKHSAAINVALSQSHKESA